MIFFTPILIDKVSTCHLFSFFESIFIKAHGLIFCEHVSDEFDVNLHQIKDNLLHNYIEKITNKFKKQNVFVIIACIVGFFEYDSLTESDSSKSIFRLAFEEIKANQLDQSKTASQKLNDETFDVNGPSTCCSSISTLKALPPSDIQSSRIFIFQASNFVFDCLSIALRRIENKNILPLIHIYLVFLRNLATIEKTMTHIERDIF